MIDRGFGMSYISHDRLRTGSEFRYVVYNEIYCRK